MLQYLQHTFSSGNALKLAVCIFGIQYAVVYVISLLDHFVCHKSKVQNVKDLSYGQIQIQQLFLLHPLQSN